ncbi:hypothetical protein CR513_28185, partial [Mucuna pruriens]
MAKKWYTILINILFLLLVIVCNTGIFATQSNISFIELYVTLEDSQTQTSQQAQTTQQQETHRSKQ